MTVSGIRDIEFDTDVFASLEIPENHKQHLKALVELYSGEMDEHSDDIIKGQPHSPILLAINRIIQARVVASLYCCTESQGPEKLLPRKAFPSG